MSSSDDPSPATGDPRRLRCSACGETYRDRWRCRCGAPLDFAEPPLPNGPAPDPVSLDARAGLWAFDDLIAAGADPRNRVTLGEGLTPLVDADRSRGPGDDAGREAAPWDASFKLEYVFPTGSFKDRGATTTLTRARELGVERVVEDSSGNAGAAVATYAARAGIDAEIYVPADAKESKLRAIRRAGAEPVRIEGSRGDVTDACVAALGDADDVVGDDADDAGGPAWYASHAWNPAFFEGTATVAYEVAFQRGWDAPDAVVTPLGHGTLFLGAYRGFRRL